MRIAILSMLWLAAAKNLSIVDKDCNSLCKLVGGCDDQGSYCRENGTCHNMYRYRRGVCLYMEDGNCPSKYPVSCEQAALINPDTSCQQITPSSYCKVNKSGNSRVCHGIGTLINGLPCQLGTAGCLSSRPFTCDSAIILSNGRKH